MVRPHPIISGAQRSSIFQGVLFPLQVHKGVRSVPTMPFPELRAPIFLGVRFPLQGHKGVWYAPTLPVFELSAPPATLTVVDSRSRRIATLPLT